MLKFRYQNVTPPGSMYVFQIPDTDIVVKAPTRLGWEDNVRKAYRQHNLTPPDNLMQVMEDYMCRILPEGFCEGDDDGKPRKRAIMIQDIRVATQNILSNGNCNALDVVATKRAATCVDCPLHDRASCTSCSGLATWATRLAGRSLTGPIAPEWLGVCGVDASLVAVKIFASRIPVGKYDESYPAKCWVLDPSEGVIRS